VGDAHGHLLGGDFPARGRAEAGALGAVVWVWAGKGKRGEVKKKSVDRKQRRRLF
jgi:hypothetical protein